MTPGLTPTSDLLVLSLPANSHFVRIHQAVHSAVWFGPAPGAGPAYRFDAPSGQYRTMYAAQQLEGAFAETILRRANRIIARPYVELRQWSVIETARELSLLKLFDEGLVWHGVTADICSGDDYRISQSFAAALYASHSGLDGIAYRARHNNGQICYALFDRIAETSLQVVEKRLFSNERSITDALLRKHNASWDPMIPLPPP
ncbi:RES family NAD+ phosphorylase [Rhizobium lemnae]|uniref:RES family NAD+ phosphorylase n=1 Tax=Rhizobium lemnae TaxID=1214924 RepID=A0ABV8EDE4_9HYPH|nr:RES family NAD+ phosphorylase [Rhizobium lemnae]MCJ8508634.1 RES family NAD+ phosphorylase [Rhizobium lemnae]